MSASGYFTLRLSRRKKLNLAKSNVESSFVNVEGSMIASLASLCLRKYVWWSLNDTPRVIEILPVNSVRETKTRVDGRDTANFSVHADSWVALYERTALL